MQPIGPGRYILYVLYLTLLYNTDAGTNRGLLLLFTFVLLKNTVCFSAGNAHKCSQRFI
jgi:hypothetical protein